MLYLLCHPILHANLRSNGIIYSLMHYVEDKEFPVIFFIPHKLKVIVLIERKLIYILADAKLSL